jgi:membrane protease YdiL (CAAX protease family)
MADAATIGVLRDLAILVTIATALALFGYRTLRLRRPEVSWNQEGQVLSRPYAAPDLILLALLGVFFISTMQAPSGEQADAAISSAGIILSMVFNLMVCAALLLYLHRLRGLNPAELFGLQHLHWRSIARVVLVFAVICLISVSLVAIGVTQWLEGVWPDLQPQQMVETFQTSGSLGIKVLVVIAAVVIAPLAEETLFRGFVYGVLKRYTDAPFAALASSLMFAIIHLHVGSLLPLCVLAVLFCIAYEITGCLLVPMLLHMIFNATSIVMMLFTGVPSGG